MRSYEVAAYTLAVLVVSEMAGQAGEAPHPETPETSSLPLQWSEIQVKTETRWAGVIANPEVVSNPQFLTGTLEESATIAPPDSIDPSPMPPSEPGASLVEIALPTDRGPIPEISGAKASSAIVAQNPAELPPGSADLCASGLRCPRPEPIAPLVLPERYAPESSPALSIYIPTGIGADNTTAFITGTYQSDTRNDDGSAGTAGFGIGYGDADRAVGLEISYVYSNNGNFGEGGFNAKLHKRLPSDLAMALGWNGFLNIGRNDFEQSLYGVVTKVFRTRESVEDPFSRIAVTIGLGDGQFRSNGAVEDGANNINVFGNIAIRVARPLSLITEWTGQDLAMGLSIAPFRNFPLTITPAVRDITGANDDPRFVLGAGLSFQL